MSIAITGPESLSSMWVNIVSTMAAAATGVLAWFAKVQIDSANREKRDRRLVADARVSALAYAVRRQLRSWLALESAPDTIQWKAEVAPTFTRSENCLQMALTEVHASPHVRTSLHGALVCYYRAMDTFDQVPPPANKLSTDRPTTLPGRVGTLRAEVASCAESLTGAIDPELEAANLRIPSHPAPPGQPGSSGSPP